MAKKCYAILDMPETCAECVFCVKGCTKYWDCELDKNLLLLFDVFDEKHKECPLKEVIE